MATLDSLKQALTRAVPTTKEPLSETQYDAGFNTLLAGPGWTVYQDFIVPQLCQLLTPLVNSCIHISVLEIGPGPKSILGYLPGRLSRQISKYVAFEPNHLFAAKLEEWLCSTSKTELPFPCLKTTPQIYRTPFGVNADVVGETSGDRSEDIEKFDVIIFCHSMYGMNPRRKFIEKALDRLSKQSEGSMAVVFHRDGDLGFDGLVCHRTASFPTGVVAVPDNDEVLDQFASFIAGFVTQDEAIKIGWRKTCRALARRDETSPNHLFFSSPEIMVAFTRHATALPELTAQVPVLTGVKIVKNREAQLHRPALVVKPTEVLHIQHCVRWAVKHGLGLTVIGGSHSGHCVWPNVVSVDMGAFDKVHVLPEGDDGEKSVCHSGALIVAEAGCKTGDIVRKTLAAGFIVPLGARPSVGAGLWLQGGIGHLTRLHGLACDAIVGAVLVSAESGQVFYIGCVPSQHRQGIAVCPENEADLLWAMKGAGTNYGIVVSFVFKAYRAPTYSVRNWIIPTRDILDARRRLEDFDELVAKKLPRNCSADAYLYWDNDQLHLGVTMFESLTSDETHMPTPAPIHAVLGPENHSKIVDSIGLFECEMYMSGMHGGHGGGKTSSFKRCMFLKGIGRNEVAEILMAAMESRPSELCYLHLLHGGGAVADVPAEASAFGCRDWDFACVITGVWSRDQDGTEINRAAVRWVYSTAMDLLPFSKGAYGADLGPDPRDAALVAMAFGPNRSRLTRLKHTLDPSNILAYACPLVAPLTEPKLIILVTGESCAGKDYCANIWVSMFKAYSHDNLTARVVSISDVTKLEYAAATGANLERLLSDRAYKEQHRSALTSYFQDQVRKRPRLPEEHFIRLVNGALDVDVLLITGMRDEAPVTAFSHLAPGSRLLDVRVRASEETRQIRRGCHGVEEHREDTNGDLGIGHMVSKTLAYRPNLVFDNTVMGNTEIEKFAEDYLLPFVHEDLYRLFTMVHSVPGFPRRDIMFRHVLDISQQRDGLDLCASLLQTHFTGDWAKVDAVACCEAGGFIYGPTLAARVKVPLLLIREAGKLPPPTFSTARVLSHISASMCRESRKLNLEMSRNAVRRGASVVIVDDVLATGATLCAVLRLLGQAGVDADHVKVMVVAEFPAHRGRERLRQAGFGGVCIQSLLVFDGD